MQSGDLRAWRGNVTSGGEGVHAVPIGDTGWLKSPEVGWFVPVAVTLSLLVWSLKYVPTPSFDDAYDQISSLADNFHEHRHAYMRPDYSEAQARQDFIDKQLTSFGWDVAHNFQRNPFEQEVHVERNVDVGHSQKRADYAFYIKPNYRDVRFLTAYLQAELTREHVAAQERMSSATTRLTIAAVVLAVATLVVTAVPIAHSWRQEKATSTCGDVHAYSSAGRLGLDSLAN